MEIKRTPEFREWLDGLRDVAGRARIQARIERLAAGNPGDHRNLEGGISEMRVDVGPGYRLYYTRRGRRADCASGWRRQGQPEAGHPEGAGAGRGLLIPP
jgi:putative addiction module killer protein